MKYCYTTVDWISCIQLVIGFIACRMLSHFMYIVRNNEIKMFNQSINQTNKQGLDAEHQYGEVIKNLSECNVVRFLVTKVSMDYDAYICFILNKASVW